VTEQNSLNKYSPYLAEVRKRLILIVSFFFIGMIGGFVFYEKIVVFLISILNLNSVNIVFTTPFQFINLAFSCGFVCGTALAFPFIITQLLSFLRPALKEKEYKTVLYILPFSIVLFVLGFLFGGIIMRWQIQMFLGRSNTLGIGNILDITKLLSVILLTSTIMGIGFQAPIALLALMRTKFIKKETVSKQRPWVYLGAFVFALLLPIDSVIADLILTLPLVLLFEFTLLLHKILERGVIRNV